MQQDVAAATAAMQSAAGMFTERANEFNRYLGNVNEDMLALQGSWQGKASMQFNAAMDQWESAFQTVINELLGMAETMGVNTTVYHQQEDGAVDIAQSFASALPGV